MAMTFKPLTLEDLGFCGGILVEVEGVRVATMSGYDLMCLTRRFGMMLHAQQAKIQEAIELLESNDPATAYAKLLQIGKFGRDN